MTEPAIHTHQLRKRYGDLEAVRGVNLTVARGEVFCLLGPNGAGKTSVVEILEGYRAASGGEATVLGIPVGRAGAPGRQLYDRIGIVPQSCGVPADLTVSELVEMYGRYHRAPRPVDEVLSLVELGGRAGERAGRLSGGERRRLDLAIALVGDPELIFLDEPTTGFDPAARRQAWSAIRSLCELDRTVLLTTHFMDEAQHLADRVAVMRAGRIVAEGRPDELAGRDRRPAEIRVRLTEGLGLLDLPPATDGRWTRECGADGGGENDRDGVGGGVALLRTHHPVATTHALTAWALDGGRTLPGLSIAQPTLEDIYLELTGEPAGSRDDDSVEVAT